MKNLYIKILTIAFILTSVIVKAQDPLSLYYLENVPQSSLLNPAMAPRANGFIGIPASNIYFRINTDIYGKNLIQKQGDEYVTLTNAKFDYSKFYKIIGDNANLNSYQTIAPIAFGFSGKRGYFTFFVTEKISESVAIPKDFFRMIDKGFPNGSNFDFSSIFSKVQWYREWSFGYSYNFMDKLRVGIHAKYLQGIVAAKTDFDKFELSTGLEEWNVNLDGKVYMSVPAYISYDEDGIPSLDSVPADLGTIVDKGILNFSNPGFAIDLGAVYEYNKVWKFSASINDLGFINWNGDLNTFEVNGTYFFKGVDIDITNIDSLDEVAGIILDSLKRSVNLAHSRKGFSTGLGPKLYLGALYKVNYYFSAGFVSRSIFAKNNFQQEFNISANLNLYHILTTTINYTYAINGTNTFGLGLGLRAGPVQFYTALDYIPYSYYKKVTIKTTDDNGNPVEVPFIPTNFNNFNFMIGLNILFGPNGYKDEPIIDAYSEF
jgi:hypothetical protein